MKKLANLKVIKPQLSYFIVTSVDNLWTSVYPDPNDLIHIL